MVELGDGTASRTAPGGCSLGDGPARRPRSRRGEGDRLRTEIIDVASRMLGESGAVDELSLRAVARAVGVATTSLYLHFRNIDELVLAVKLRYYEEFGAALAAAADAAGPVPLDRLRARAHRYVGYGMEQRGRYWVMFSSQMQPSHLLVGRPYPGAEVFGAVRAELGGVVADPVEADLVAVHMWTALHGIVTLRTVRRNFPWPDQERQIDDLIYRMVGPA